MKKKEKKKRGISGFISLNCTQHVHQRIFLNIQEGSSLVQVQYCPSSLIGLPQLWKVLEYLSIDDQDPFFFLIIAPKIIMKA